MARTNLAVLPDVTSCLRDAMDMIFNDGTSNEAAKNKQNGHTLVTPDDNDIIVDIDGDDDQTSTDGLSQSSLNKRKLTNVGNNSIEQSNQDTKTAKRICTTNGHH